jgi:hypothetical protein
MPRDLTPFIIQSLTRKASDNSLDLKTHVAIEIFLPNDPVPLRLATGAITMSSKNVLGVSTAITAASFVASVRKVSDFRFSIGSAVDGGEIELEHLSLAWAGYFAIGFGGLDGCEAVLYECFKKSDGTYEGDPFFIGIVSDVRAVVETVQISFESDMNQKGALVGRPITQHCFARFFEDELCGHTGAPPGSTCSFIKNDAVGGCAFWRWEAHFVGAPFETAGDPATGQPVADINRREFGGWDGEGAPIRPRRLDPDSRQFSVI